MSKLFLSNCSQTNIMSTVQLQHYFGKHQPTITKQGSSPFATLTTGLIIQQNSSVSYLNTTFHHLHLDDGAASIWNQPNGWLLKQYHTHQHRHQHHYASFYFCWTSLCALPIGIQALSSGTVGFPLHICISAYSVIH